VIYVEGTVDLIGKLLRVSKQFGGGAGWGGAGRSASASDRRAGKALKAPINALLQSASAKRASLVSHVSLLRSARCAINQQAALRNQTLSFSSLICDHC